MPLCPDIAHFGELATPESSRARIVQTAAELTYGDPGEGPSAPDPFFSPATLVVLSVTNLYIRILESLLYPTISPVYHYTRVFIPLFTLCSRICAPYGERQGVSKSTERGD